MHHNRVVSSGAIGKMHLTALLLGPSISHIVCSHIDLVSQVVCILLEIAFSRSLTVLAADELSMSRGSLHKICVNLLVFNIFL